MLTYMGILYLIWRQCR